jgi:hypothetical protein
VNSHLSRLFSPWDGIHGEIVLLAPSAWTSRDNGKVIEARSIIDFNSNTEDLQGP